MRILIRAVLLLALGGTLGGCSDAGALLYRGAVEAERILYGLERKAVQLDELTLHYYEGGDAGHPTVVLVHGFTADKDNWPRFARHLLADYHVLIPDLAGHGETGFDPAWDYSMPAQADRLAQFLDALGTGPVHMAGNSMGGFITATFAVRHGEQVLSIALLDAAGVQAPQPSPMDRQLAAGRNPFLFDDPAAFQSFWTFAMQDPPWMPGVVVQHLGGEYVRRRKEFAYIFQEFAGKDLLDARLGEIRVPALVLWGRADRLLDVSMAQVFGDGIPGARVVILEGVGHLPMVERPAQSAGIYRDFLREAGA